MTGAELDSSSEKTTERSVLRLFSPLTAIMYLLPIQMGEKEAGKVLAVDRNVSNQYFAMEDEAVTMAEYQML